MLNSLNGGHCTKSLIYIIFNSVKLDSSSQDSISAVSETLNLLKYRLAFFSSYNVDVDCFLTEKVIDLNNKHLYCVSVLC